MSSSVAIVALIEHVDCKKEGGDDYHIIIFQILEGKRVTLRCCQSKIYLLMKSVRAFMVCGTQTKAEQC